MTKLFRPDDTTELLAVVSSQTVAAGATVSFSADIDGKQYEHVVVAAIMHASTSAMSVTPKKRGSASASYETNLEGALAFAADEDDNAAWLDVRVAGEHLVNVDVAAVGGTSGTISLLVFGVNPIDTQNLPAGTTIVAASTLA